MSTLQKMKTNNKELDCISEASEAVTTLSDDS